MNNSVLFASRSVEWTTPAWLFHALDREFGFTLDPCATPANATCARYYTIADDGLAQSWDDEVVFMNPPYGRVIGQWMRKAYESSRDGALVVCLIPARTDTEWWHRYAMRGEIRLLKGRLKFGGAKHGAPFPSAIVVFRPAGFALRTQSFSAQQHQSTTREKKGNRINGNQSDDQQQLAITTAAPPTSQTERRGLDPLVLASSGAG